VTRRVPPPARAEITRVVGRHNRRSGSQGSEGSVSSDWLDGDLTVVRAVLDKLADEIAEDGVAAFTAVLERAGLRSHVGKADVLRAIREYVFESLLGALWERITEIESKPDVIARLTVSTRESMLELLAEYTR
jgi:hypothetical protein